MFPSSSTSASGIPSARVYLGLVLRFFGSEASARGENGVNKSVMATHERRTSPSLESVLWWPFPPGRKCAMPSLLGVGLVGSDIVLELQGEMDEMLEEATEVFFDPRFMHVRRASGNSSTSFAFQSPTTFDYIHGL